MSTFQDDEDATQAASRDFEDTDPGQRQLTWRNGKAIALRLVSETEGLIAKLDRLHAALSGDPDKQAEIASLKNSFINQMQSKLT